jgi:1-acyl-sn-glycerol-3-phosphate acyltransferase
MSATSTSPRAPAADGRWRDLVQVLFFALLVRPFMALFIGLRVRGREHLATPDPFILVANHSSHLDTLSLLSLFPLGRLRRLRPCAAADYFDRTPLIALLSRTFFNVLPIERVHIRPEEHPIQRMREALERGESLLLFPEGTRGQGGDLGPFKPGIAYLAEQLPRIPVVPAYLENMGRALPKGELLPVPFFCEARIGPPRHLSGDRDAMLAALRGALETLRDAGTDVHGPGAARSSVVIGPLE